MKNFEKTRKQREQHLAETLEHTPTTGIIERIKAASPGRGIITDVLITPEIARDLLTLNTDNRPADYKVIKRYTEMMKNGQWVYTGETIKLTDDLRLIDCQQRLFAIIEAGTPQKMHIQTGIGEAAFAVIDTGRTRSAADALAIAGLAEVNVLAAAIKQEIYFREQGLTSARIFRNRVLPLQIIEWTTNERNMKFMVSAVEYATRYLHKKGKFLSPTTWAFLYYTLGSIRGGRQQAINFVTLAASGENVSLGNETSPVYLLREKLQQIQSEKYIGSKISTDLKMRYFITAWNHYRRGEIIKKLVIDTKETKLPQPI